jgi:hypothetical protein
MNPYWLKFIGGALVGCVGVRLLLWGLRRFDESRDAALRRAVYASSVRHLEHHLHDVRSRSRDVPS